MTSARWRSKSAFRRPASSSAARATSRARSWLGSDDATAFGIMPDAIGSKVARSLRYPPRSV